jgi:hypothetical protein
MKFFTPRSAERFAMDGLHDVDVIVLMATTLSSKRRPAELLEILAAADVLQGFVPSADKLGEAIECLSSLGLITEAEGGFTLTEIALASMAKLHKKADTEESIIAIKADLAACSTSTIFPAAKVTKDQLDAAVKAYKIAKKVTGQNLLMPRPKNDRHFKVEGRWRRAAAKR